MAGPRAPTDKVPRERWREHHGRGQQHAWRGGGGDGSPEQRLDVWGQSGGGATMSNSGGGAPVMGGIVGRVLQCRRRRERMRCTPIASHDAQRTDSPRRRKSTPVVAQTSGGEAVRRPGDDVDRLSRELGGSGAWSRWRRKQRGREARSAAGGF
jgi:hypothetical protein